MTPEERAVLLTREMLTRAEEMRPSSYAPWRDCDIEHLSRLVAVAIHGAVEAERERCAKVAEEGVEQDGWGPSWGSEVGRQIAAAIRKG